MTNDLQAAAERLRRGEYTHAPGGRAQEWLDLMMLAREWLASNPADDGEPIDRKWVFGTFRITINGAEINERLYLKQSRKGWGVYALCEANEYGECMEEFLVFQAKTRGQLRRLASALGLELKEPTNG